MDKSLEKYFFYFLGAFFMLGYWTLVPVGPLFYVFEREVYDDVFSVFMPWRWWDD